MAQRAAMLVHVVTVVKAPSNFRTWALYHGRHQGCVLHVFYDTPLSTLDFAVVALDQELRNLGVRYHLDTVATPTTEAGVFLVNQSRQQWCVDVALRRIERDYAGHENWAFHIDDDELVYAFADTIYGCVRANRSRGSTWTMRNWEARVDVVDAESIFDAHLFETDPRRFLVYANGKACARVTPTTRLEGPHCFSLDGRPQCGTHLVDNLVVLHYNCTTYRKWKAKYAAYANRPQNESVFLFDQISDALHRLQKPDGLMRAYYLSRVLAYHDGPSQSIVDLEAFHRLLRALR